MSSIRPRGESRAVQLGPAKGLGMTPPTYLAVGDVMTLGIDGLGEQRQTVAPPR